MKKVLIIYPGNLNILPFSKSYEKVFLKEGVEVKKIVWDRLGQEIESNNKYIYRDKNPKKEKARKRNILDYIKYSKYIKEILEKEEFDGIVIFTIQLAFFVKKYLKNKRYIFDIRDYHLFNKFFNINKFIKKSEFTVISSPGFKKWLPKNKYIINHNTNFIDIPDIPEIKLKKDIRLSFMGALRDLEVNKILMGSLANIKRYSLYYHGAGGFEELAKEIVKKENYENVYFTGRFDGDKVLDLYKECNLSNLLLGEDINSRTLLANRLYNSLYSGIPILTISNTLTGNLVEKYKIGLTVNLNDDFLKKIEKYIEDFDFKTYSNGRKKLLERIVDENNLFEKTLKNFIRE